MKKYLFLLLVCAVSCQAKEDNCIKDLQDSVCKLSSAAIWVDNDTESIWAYGMADSIAKSMELKDESQWRDLARAYSALSYISYGMSYTRSAIRGNRDDFIRISDILVPIDPDTILPNQSLHFDELMADIGFAKFYDVSNMERAEDMYDASSYFLHSLDSIYAIEDIAPMEQFWQFQRLNNNFYFIYVNMLADLYSINSSNDKEFEKKRNVLTKLGEELDFLPEDRDEMLATKIKVRAKLLNMLANEILSLK